MSLSSASYVARRAAQKQKVRLLYRRSVRDTLNWAVHRHLFYSDADELRKKFDASSNVDDLDTIDRMIADGDAEYNKWRHPDPYLGKLSDDDWYVPWAPGGTKFCKNPGPPKGIEIIYDYGQEEAELKLSIQYDFPMLYGELAKLKLNQRRHSNDKIIYAKNKS
ncbi:hypothetical protein Cgig2_032563 [Carnegiea gigantea]|uniref:NADH dehydrogenase [ubiquinone] 1 beta subcomplex subunit 9 n=1 Tax=Carnegiea gigantea TaxID=171969 RepID=A0A9Q1KWQ5_9CARY|nr:hypothetical protein Cgig2_032563 [Carnegiea gigantea]